MKKQQQKRKELNKDEIIERIAYNIKKGKHPRKNIKIIIKY